ncbi:hypothetical protein BDN72DRAFT_294394 [Pluteus cervinus]|uniref:Uncharacterized protein n=1 Tax=Pluteus cervinus TaxID=181527 RepID=A0ACD3B4I2_9AGAR|nr:hypothetical protein BDN72DRAFT_294394 [Pluteus cervinus]
MDQTAQVLDRFKLLPDELILAIIKCIGVEATVRGYHSNYPKDLPVFMQLSRRWRDIILTEPSFWCQIRMCPSVTAVHQVTTYLERSKEHPLSVYWVDSSEVRSDQVSPLWTLVTQFSHRWRMLALQVSEAFHLDALLVSLQDISIPILNEIHIATSASLPSSAVQLSAQSQLRHIVLNYYPLSAIKFRQELITHLELRPLERFSYDKFTGLIDNMPSLQFLSLADAFDWKVQDWPLIRAPSLLTLVMADSLYYIWRYIKVFDCPKLQSLVLSSIGHDDFPLETCLKAMLQYTAVEELALVGSSLDALAMVSVCVPNIIHLSLLVRDHRVHAHSGLDLSDTWPHLRSVSINPMAEEISCQAIVNIVKHRQRSGHPLETIFIPEEQWGLLTELETKVECNVRMRSLPCAAQYRLPPVYYPDVVSFDF